MVKKDRKEEKEISSLHPKAPNFFSLGKNFPSPFLCGLIQ
jgi:hypothetical protein